MSLDIATYRINYCVSDWDAVGHLGFPAQGACAAVNALCDEVERLGRENQEVNAARIYLREKEGLLRELQTERTLSFRNQVAELEQQLYAEKTRCDEYMEDNKRLSNQNAMLRDALEKYAPFDNELEKASIEALAATADLSNLVLCEGEPAEYQYQDRGGSWKSFLNDDHKDNTIKSGEWNIRKLYRAREQK